MRQDVWQARLERLEAQHLTRNPRVLSSPSGPVVRTADDRERLMFCSNDYLGLCGHPDLVEAFVSGLGTWGAGAPSSRLVAGNTVAHDQAERCLANFVGAEQAVLFPSGYQANLGALGALTDAGDAIFSDERNHASLIDGCRLSRAATHIYRHNDLAHLSELLGACDAPGQRLVVTEAIFSMDGDRVPLADLVTVARRHDALVYVDEAHSLGVLGHAGRGLTNEVGCEDAVAVRVGTLGKAFGLVGAFVATSAIGRKLIVSRGRALLYTTAQPPALAEAVCAAVQLVEAADDRRVALFENVIDFRSRAAHAGLPLLPSDTPIQPLLVGDAERVMALSDWLFERGLFVQGIRPPTVPEGTSRLRITLMATHEVGQIRELVAGLAAGLAAVS